MEMFNVHRRDIMDFDNYMDLKKPGFGGPSSAKMYRDGKGNLVNKNPKLKDYQHTVERDPAFSHQVYDPTYKAMTHDLVYKQAKKKPFTYTDPYKTALPVIEIEPANEGKSYTSFSSFVNEMYGMGANPQEEQKISLRGRTDLDAVGDAEDKLEQARVAWDDFYMDKDENGDLQKVEYTDADGDLIAYVDVKARKLYIMPDAPTMDEPMGKEEMPMDTEMEGPEEEEDAYYKLDPEEEQFADVPSIEKTRGRTESSEIKDIERLLQSFEEGDEDEY